MIIGLIGAYALFKKNKKFFLFLLLIFLINVFAHSQLKGNWEFFNLYLPSFLIFSIWAGLGIKELFAYISNKRDKKILRYVIIIFLIFLFIKSYFILRFPNLEVFPVYHSKLDDNFYPGILNEADNNSIVFADWISFTVVYYHQQIYGLRQDLEIYEYVNDKRTYGSKFISGWESYAKENFGKRKIYHLNAGGISLIEFKNETR